jgi:hypothetical protein
MKVADHKTTNETNVHVLSYFSTTFNAGVPPGGFIWLPSSTGSPALNTPVQSPQIFQEYMDETTYKEKFLTLDGTNFTYAILQATTIDNAAFGVVGGQAVELLVLHTNPTFPRHSLVLTIPWRPLSPLQTWLSRLPAALSWSK